MDSGGLLAGQRVQYSFPMSSAGLQKTALYEPLPNATEWKGDPHSMTVHKDIRGTRVDVAHVLEQELVQGYSLDRFSNNGVSNPDQPFLNPRGVVECIAQAGLGVAAAHEKGIIHRDLKPANVLVEIVKGKRGSRLTAKVADFGFGLLLENALRKSRTTASGVTAGTPIYMPPEQWGNFKHADCRSDVYSLAASLFTQLGGKLDVPDENPSIPQVMGAQRSHGLINNTNLETLRLTLPSDLVGIVDIIRKATRRNPAERYQSMQEFVAALAPFRPQDGETGGATEAS